MILHLSNMAFWSSLRGTPSVRVDGASCCCHVAVEPNRSYIFTVEATTGRSSASSRPSPPVFAPARVPQAPAAPQVLAVDGLAAELRWNTFSCGGGLPIEGFKVGVLDAASPGGSHATVDATRASPSSALSPGTNLRALPLAICSLAGPMALQLSLNVAGLQDAQVGPDVQKIGVSFRSFPPEPVVINSVMPETWGQGRFQGGEEVVAVNGIDVATMDRDAFREALQVRPLTIRFRVPAQDQLDSVVAEKGVEKIGLVFQQLPPAPVIVSKVQESEGSWAAQQGFEGGEEIVMVNGKELSQMSADDFKKALKEERPLALRFRPRELPDGVEELVAEKEVGKIGLSFLKMPPEPVIVNKVIPGCWAEEVGFQGGEEIVALDGAPVASMTPETFKAALQQRPLRLRFRPAGHKEQEEQEEEEEDDEEPVEVTADAKVKKIGLSFRELPPQPVVVSKVVPETWASQMGFRGGEEIVALNGQPCEAMNSATFKELLGIRPLTLRYFPPLEDGGGRASFFPVFLRGDGRRSSWTLVERTDGFGFTRKI
eukprot:g30954.t1